MKRLAWIVIVGCGGSSRPAASPSPSPSPSPCIAMAAHVAATTRTKGNTDNAELLALNEEDAVVIEPVLAERCQADAWPPDVIACHQHLTDQDSAMNVCGDLLTEEQRSSLENQLAQAFRERAAARE
jgi:hypothetical protein